MDDSTDGLGARSQDDCHHREGIEFSSERPAYAESVWSPRSAKPRTAEPISLARARAGLARHSRPAPALDEIIVGSSPQANSLRDMIGLYADEEAPVLIAGETGVGKELVARALHRQSARADKAFVPLNIGAVPETLAAAELFGHVKGAFTGALADRDGAFQTADGGALFLDEIGDAPLSVQAQLLRVLDDGMVTKIGARAARKVDVRLIAATNVELTQATKNGEFRRDLFYRVNVLQIDVPPLRERGDDVIEIAEAMIANHPIARHRTKTLTPSAERRLRSHHFPGNVRELRNVISRAVVHADGDKIYDEHLTFAGTPRLNGASASDVMNVNEAKDLVNRFLMIKALKIADGNVSKAAKLTGRARGTVHALKKQLDGEDFVSAYETACARMKALIEDC
ncbi:MAG: sigma 54-interacting transcriptional regulator [Hyphococcus sp.]